MNNNIARILLGTLGLLLVPLVAMQFTDEVNWTGSDFLIMGTLIFVTGLLIDWALRKAGKYRIITAIGIFVLFLCLWAEMAVGVFTNWGS